jgi:superoxide oxidase
MNWRNTTTRYGSLSIGMHWFMLLLLVAIYACIELRENYPRGSEVREALKTWHYMLGMGAFALAWLRLGFRLTGPTPRIEPESPAWQMMLAKLMYLALYLLMIGLPLLGWLILSAEGDPIPFFGLHLPALIGENKELAKTLEEIHATGGTIGYFLIGFHAIAALYHHYIRRDNTLARILPRKN